MKQNYDVSLTRLLRDEGGYTNNPNDRGGPTNFGITLADYRKYIDSDGDAEDVRNMKVSDAKRIYKSKYWDAIGGDTLPAGVDYSLFDYAVNSGVGKVKPYLALVGKVPPKDLIVKINDERLAFLRRLATRPGQSDFLNGWTKRVVGVKAFSLQLASGTKITTGTGTAGAVIAGGATAVATTPVHFWPYILVGTAIIAVITWVVIRHNKRTTNVTVS